MTRILIAKPQCALCVSVHKIAHSLQSGRKNCISVLARQCLHAAAALPPWPPYLFHASPLSSRFGHLVWLTEQTASYSPNCRADFVSNFSTHDSKVVWLNRGMLAPSCSFILSLGVSYVMRDHEWTVHPLRRMWGRCGQLEPRVQYIARRILRQCLYRH